MSLVPYTNTYTDTDGSIADADDIINEFDRVATFINTWADAYESIGLTEIVKHAVLSDDDGSLDIDPANGLVQTAIVDAVVTEIDFNILERTSDDPYRVYLSLRFASKATTFTVSGPTGKAQVFGVNKETYTCSQTVNNGYYSAAVIVTYATGGMHIQVYADNPETEAPGDDDVLQGAAR